MKHPKCVVCGKGTIHLYKGRSVHKGKCQKKLEK